MAAKTYQGTLCKRGHDDGTGHSTRYINKSTCVKCNREKRRESDRKRYKANPEKVRETKRKWREANPEKHRESTRKWQKRRAMKQFPEGPLREERERLYELNSLLQTTRRKAKKRGT